MESRVGASYIVDYRDVHVSPLILYTTYTDIQTMDPTQAIRGGDRSREGSEIERDDRHLERGKLLSRYLKTYAHEQTELKYAKRCMWGVVGWGVIIALIILICVLVKKLS